MTVSPWNQMPRATNVTQTNEDREPWCNIFPHSKSCGTINEQTDLTHSTWTPSRPKGDPPSFGDLWQSSSEHLQPQPFLKQSFQLKHCLGPQLATARINIYVTWLSEVCAFAYVSLYLYIYIYICSQITNMDINKNVNIYIYVYIYIIYIYITSPALHAEFVLHAGAALSQGLGFTKVGSKAVRGIWVKFEHRAGSRGWLSTSQALHALFLLHVGAELSRASAGIVLSSFPARRFPWLRCWSNVPGAV